MYEEPKRLPDPLDLPAPSVLPLYVVTLGVVPSLALLLLGAAQFGYVFVLYDLALGWLLGSALAVGIRWGRYPLAIGRLTTGASIAVFLLFHLGVYLQSIHGVSGAYPDFASFLAYRASEQPLVFGYRPGTLWMLAIWLAEVGLTAYVALRIANRALASVRLNAVPTEVTEFVLYLLFLGKGATQIEAELAQRGWTERRDVVRAFDAADVAASLIGPSGAPTAESPASE